MVKKDDEDVDGIRKDSHLRMKLHRMSEDNKFFLFEDKYLKKYKICTLQS